MIIDGYDAWECAHAEAYISGGSDSTITSADLDDMRPTRPVIGFGSTS